LEPLTSSVKLSGFPNNRILFYVHFGFLVMSSVEVWIILMWHVQ